MTNITKTGRRGYDSHTTKAANHFKAARVASRKYGRSLGEVVQESFDCGAGIDIHGGESIAEYGAPCQDASKESAAHRVSLGLEAMAKLDGLAARLGIPAKVHAANMAALWAEYATVQDAA